MANIVRNSEFPNDSWDSRTSAYESGLSKVFHYFGSTITFKNTDGIVYANATEMAKHFGKFVGDWLRLKSTEEYLKALSTDMGILISELYQSIRGGNGIQGTWMYEDVAIEFARWLSPSFGIWCNNKIKELLVYGTTSLHNYSRPTMSSEELEVKRKELDLKGAEILERLAQRTTIPEYHQIIDHYIMEKVTGNPDALPLPVCTEKTYTATQIGNMLGVSANRIGKVANAWNLKTPENGKWFYDKSRSSNKEVETFRYNERGVNLLREIINKEGYGHKQKRRNEEDIPDCNTLFSD